MEQESDSYASSTCSSSFSQISVLENPNRRLLNRIQKIPPLKRYVFPKKLSENNADERIRHTEIIQQNPNALVIFLHNLNEVGSQWKSTIESILPINTKAVFPTAKLIPVTLFSGIMCTSWVDVLPVPYEDVVGYENILDSLSNIIKNEIDENDITSNRVIIGGYAQGGSVALHTALRIPLRLGGVFCFNSWLPLSNQYPAALSQFCENIPILQCHGLHNKLITIETATHYSIFLSTMTNRFRFKAIPNMGVEFNENALPVLYDFLTDVLK
uniref:palmitoyl-protein hydrolase n=1 Tax=Dinothrombium tinctorium TaxID=1965070 RepID=A0A3S3P392_9ACAR